MWVVWMVRATGRGWSHRGEGIVRSRAAKVAIELGELMKEGCLLENFRIKFPVAEFFARALRPPHPRVCCMEPRYPSKKPTFNTLSIFGYNPALPCNATLHTAETRLLSRRNEPLMAKNNGSTWVVTSPLNCLLVAKCRKPSRFWISSSVCPPPHCTPTFPSASALSSNPVRS